MFRLGKHPVFWKFLGVFCRIEIFLLEGEKSVKIRGKSGCFFVSRSIYDRSMRVFEIGRKNWMIPGDFFW